MGAGVGSRALGNRGAIGGSVAGGGKVDLDVVWWTIDVHAIIACVGCGRGRVRGHGCSSVVAVARSVLLDLPPFLIMSLA